MYTGIDRRIAQLKGLVTNYSQQGQHEQAVEYIILFYNQLDLKALTDAQAEQLLGLTVACFNDWNQLDPKALADARAEQLPGLMVTRFNDWARRVRELTESGQFDQALPLASRAYDLAGQILGKDDTVLLLWLQDLAILYDGMGDFAAAEPLYLRVLEAKRKIPAFLVDKATGGIAMSLTQLGLLYEKMKNYTAAKSYLRQALEITRTDRGASDPDVLALLKRLAALCETMDNYGEAKLLRLQALEIDLDKLGEDHEDVISDRIALASLYKKTGNYIDAETLWRQVLEVTRRTHGDQHLEVAMAMDNLAHLHQIRGRYTAAEPFFHLALEIRRKTLGEGHSEVGLAMNNLANLYYAMGNYAAAKPLFHQAIDIQRRALGESHPDVIAPMSNLAMMYFVTGNYAAAEPLLRQTLDLTRSAPGEMRLPQAIVLDHLAQLQQSMGDYTAALQNFREALDLLNTVNTAQVEAYPDVAALLNNSANLLRMMGGYNEAIQLLLEARDGLLATLGGKHPQLTSVQSNLAHMYHLIGRFNDAELLFQQALEVTRETLGKDHPQIALCLFNLGLLYFSKGEYNQAEPLMQEGLNILRTTLGEFHPEIAVHLINLGVVKELPSQFEPKQAHTSSNELFQLRPFFPDDSLASLYTTTGRKEEAFITMEKANAINDQTIWQVFSIGSDRQRMAYLKILQDIMNRFLSLIVQYLFGSPRAVQAGLDLILRRKAIGAEALAVQREVVLGGRYPSLESKLRELLALRMQIAQKSLTGPGLEGREEHQQLLAAWDVQKEHLEVELTRQIPEMNLEQKLRAVDRRAIANALPEGVVLVEFVRFNDFDFKALRTKDELGWKSARYLAFILHAGQPDNIHVIDLGEAAPIEKMIMEFRASITSKAESRCVRHLEHRSTNHAA